MEEQDVLQQRLLSRLTEYGDSLLDEDDYAKKKSQIWKAKMKTKPQSINDDDGQQKTPPNPPPSNSTKPKKKKKKMKSKANSAGDADSARCKRTRQLVDFEEELRQFKEEELERERRRIEAEQEKKGGQVKRPAPDVIVFEDPSRRKKKKVGSQAENESSQDEFNLKKARYEVRQFGLTGFSFEDREKCEADRAIRLGAWAPKRENINYKEYMAMQKKKKEEARLQREIDRKMGFNVAKKPTAERTRVKNQGFWRDPTQDNKFFVDGQVGRYKQGVQVLSKSDISRSRAKAQSKRRNGAGGTNKTRGQFHRAAKHNIAKHR